MSAIFISHSSKDNDIATEMRVLLEKEGYRSIFLDFNPEMGIPAGRDWEQELYAQLRASQAVIVLCSDASMQSNWCFAEITHAKALGKQVFPLKVGDCVINTVLTSRQVLDLTRSTAEDVYQRLFRGLKIAGLDPASSFNWDGKRPPYPGLMAFEEKDAAIFFGREPEIQKGLELLNRIRQFGGARMVVVLGSSGSGKSSLVKAGIVPRLRRDEERWQIVPPFRPGTDPLRELAVSLAEVLQRNRAAASPEGIHDLLKNPNRAVAAKALIQIADEFRTAAGHRDATVVLVIDQLEELLTYGAGAGAQQLLPLLEAALNAPGSPLMVISTLRSDFLGDFQLNPAAITLGFENLQLGPMPKERLFKVIEGPAEMAGLRLEAGLTQALIEDTETNDALPLLAFTLRELYEKFGDDKLLKLKEYREDLGGLAGSVATAAEAVYQAKPLTTQQQADLRHAFRTLVRINEEGKYVRQPAPRTELPASVGDVLERFVQARLLVAGGEGKKQILEVAHEALFRSWERLKLWLDEDREFLLWQQRLRSAAEEWQRTSRDSGALLRGAGLAEAERHLKANSSELKELEREYIDQSLDLRQQEQAKKERDRVQREAAQKRNIRVLTGFLGIALALTAAAAWQWQSAKRAKQRTVTELMGVSWKAGTYLGNADSVLNIDASSSYIPGSRNLYARLKLIMNLGKLASIAPHRVFSESPHAEEFNFQSNQFGHYNPKFVRWAAANLIPAANDTILRNLTHPVYAKYLFKMARYFHLAHRDLGADPTCVSLIAAEYTNEIERYKNVKWTEGGGPGYYLQESFRRYADLIKADRDSGKRNWPVVSADSLDWYQSNFAAGFWIRRHIDGTSTEFANLLQRLLTTYDPDWLQTGEAVNGTGNKIQCELPLPYFTPAQVSLAPSTPVRSGGKP